MRWRGTVRSRTKADLPQACCRRPERPFSRTKGKAKPAMDDPDQRQRRDRQRLKQIEPRKPAILHVRWMCGEKLIEALRLNPRRRHPGPRVADDTGGQLRKRRRTRGTAPAEPAQGVSPRAHDPSCERREPHNRARRESKPRADLRNDRGERKNLWMGKVPGHLVRPDVCGSGEDDQIRRPARCAAGLTPR